MFRRYFPFLAFICFSLFILFSFAGDIRFFAQPQQQHPSYELKVGARNSTIRNIGSFQVDSALIFPKRQAKDTSDGKSKALRRKGAFFYDSVTHIVWFYDGQHFRRADSSIYNSDGVIEKVRQVDIRGKDKAYLYFKNGAVHIDTLLLRKLKQGTSFDSVLVVKNDSVYRIGRDSVFNIYNKDDSIKSNRTVTLAAKDVEGKSLSFIKGSVHIDTLLLKKLKQGTSFDSVLVVKNDSVYRIGRDSVFNIYNKSDSIRSERDVVLHSYDKSKNAQKYNRLYLKEGAVHIDTLLLRKLKQGSSRDSILVVKNDSVRRISVDSLKNIYTKDDSIISNRTVVLNKKTNGSGMAKYYHLHFKGGAVWIDTLLLKNGKLGRSSDSFLVVRNDSVYRVGRDSVFNIYTKSDSIRSERDVVLHSYDKSKNAQKYNRLYLKEGSVHIDTLLLRKLKQGSSKDSILVVKNDSVRRIAVDSLKNIYTKDDSIISNRTVVLHKQSQGKQQYYNLHFKEGSVHIDTLLIRKSKISGNSRDSFLVRYKDTVKYLPFDSLRTIYNKDDSIKSNRVVTLAAKNAVGKSLTFTKGSVHIDTLLLKKSKISGNSRDSFLVRYKDTVKYLPFDSLRTIYNKDDSIKSNRIVTLAANNSEGKSLHFTKGSVHIDTLLIRKSKISGNSRDSFLVRYKDTVKYLPFDSLRTIYNKDDSIKSNRIVTLAARGSAGKSLSFVKGSVHIDTLLLRKSKISGKSRDSFLVRYKDTVKYLPFDSLRTIYNKDDSIKSNRVVTLAAARGSAGKSLSFKNGSVHIDTLLLKNRTKGTSFDSLLVVRKDSVYRIGRDSVFNIYNKSDSIKEERVVTIKAGKNKPNVTPALKFKDGRVEIDTLLVRKRRLGLSTDTFLVVHKDTVRYIPKDSLWNIYTGDDSLRKTGTTGKRTVYLNSKKLVFALGNTTTNTTNDSGKVGIGQRDPLYTLDIATNSYMSNKTSANTNSDSIAVRISHNVSDNNAGGNNHTFALLLNDFSNKAHGRSSIGFQGGSETKSFVKAAIWAEVGSAHQEPLFGISTARVDTTANQPKDLEHSTYKLVPRMFINKDGNVRIGYVNTKVKQSNGYTNSFSYDWPMKFPARLVVNTANYYGALDIGAYDTNSYSPNNTAILVNVGSKQDAEFKYGLVMREANYNRNSRIGIGFYNGGWGGAQLHTMSSRIWSRLGERLQHPMFGIDVSGYVYNYDLTKTTSIPANHKKSSLTTRMVINHLGNIGMGTMDPSTNLEIARAGSNNVIRVRAGRDDLSANIWLTRSRGDTGFLFSYKPNDTALIFRYTKSRNNNNNNGDQYSGGNGNNLLTLKSEPARIGVLTTNPQYALDIATKAALREQQRTTSATNTNDYDSIAVRITHNVTELNSNSVEYVRAQTRYGLVINENSNKAFGRSAIGFYSGFSSFMKARLWTQVGSNAKATKFGIDVADSNKRIQTRMTIDDSGLVKIGLNNEAKVKLEINGRLKINSLETGDCGDSILVIKNSVVKKICVRNGNCNTPCTVTTGVTSNLGNSNGANFLVRAGRFQPISGFYSSSDSILKRGIVSLDGSLDRVLRLRPVTYYWKDSSSLNGFSSDRQFGFIAQEVKGVFPDLVKSGVFGGSSHLTLNYIGLISPLVGAVQELYHTQERDRHSYDQLQGQVMELKSILRMNQNLGVVNGRGSYSDSVINRNAVDLSGIAGMSIINNLRPATYHMGDFDKSRLNYGFITQEYVKPINYIAIIVNLVANVQLLNQKIKNYEQENATLHSQVDRLQRSQVDELQFDKLKRQIDELQEKFSKYIESSRLKINDNRASGLD